MRSLTNTVSPSLYNRRCSSDIKHISADEVTAARRDKCSSLSASGDAQTHNRRLLFCPDSHTCFFLFPFVYLEMALFRSIFGTIDVFSCMESKSYVLSFRMVFFYVVTTGCFLTPIYYVPGRIQSINEKFYRTASFKYHCYVVCGTAALHRQASTAMQ